MTRKLHRTTGHPISRRNFFKTSALAAGAITGFPMILPSSLLFGANTPSNRIVMGTIGTGGQGTGDMRGMMGRHETQMVAVCDVDRYHRDAAKNAVDQHYKNTECQTYADFRELLARPDIDAIVCGTPENWHSLVTIAAAKAGKDIYCEKPFAPTIAEGRAAADAVKRYERILQVGSQERSRGTARFACELARNGRLGRVHTVRVNLPADRRECGPVKPEPVPESFDYNMWLGPAPWAPYSSARCHFNFRWILDYSDGELTDRGAHVADLAQWGNGTDRTGPIEIEGRGVFPPDGLYNTPYEYEIHCKFANGVNMIIATVQPRGVTFIGDEGWVMAQVHEGTLTAEPASLLKTPIQPHETHLYDDTNDHHQNFLNCIRSRRETIAPAEAGHRTTSLCHLSMIAMRLGRKLHWDPDTEQFHNDAAANDMVARAMREPWTIS